MSNDTPGVVMTSGVLICCMVTILSFLILPVLLYPHMTGPTDLELAVFRTFCWFSVFEMPLTQFGLWKWLLLPARPYDLYEVDCVLRTSDWLKGRIQMREGYWALKQVPIERWMTERHDRFLDAERKYRKLRSVCTYLQLISGVESIAAANTLSFWHTTAQSDIDLYIITRPKQIWSTRFFAVLPFLFVGHRPSLNQSSGIEDPLCFSFFATTQALQLEGIRWDQRDYYLAFWVKSLVPVIDRSGIFTQLHQLNKWADHVLPNAHPRRIHTRHAPRTLPRLVWPFPWMEFFLRFVQRGRFPPLLRALANKDSRVIIHDDLLKFHEQDRRREFTQQFEDVYQQFV